MRMVVCCLALLLLGPSAAIPAADAAHQLDGLWTATRFFGPEVRGDLWLEHLDGRFLASIAGSHATAVVAGEEVRFELPDGQGKFRGRFRNRRARILGHWIQPAGPMGSRRFATPVELRRKGKAAWRGQVTPLDERMTLHLALKTGADGATQAFLRNPERNLGIFLRLTRMTRTGDKIELWGRAVRDGPETPVLTGRYDAESDQIVVYVPNAGGSFDFARADARAEASFYPRARMSAPYAYRAPPQADDGWPIGTLGEAGIDGARITAFIQKLIDTPMDSVSAAAIHGVLIARGGRLVLEEYFHNFSRDRPHDTRSAAKSVASVLAGAAIHGGAPFDPSTRVYEFLGIQSPGDPRKERMTVQHLLTMSSGYYCDERDPSAPGAEDRMQQQTEQPDWWRYTLDVPMANEPGERAHYCGSNPNLVGAIMARATGKWLPELFHDRLAEPLDIKRYHMNLMPTDEAYLGGGIYLEPRDFMKLGQLAVGDGKWLGRQVVSPEWIERSVSPLVRVDDRDYGYFWWIQDYPYRGRTVRAAFAGGNGGQIVMAIPELDLVIAFYGGNFNDRSLYIPQNVLVPEDILPAVSDPAADE